MALRDIMGWWDSDRRLLLGSVGDGCRRPQRGQPP